MPFWSEGAPATVEDSAGRMGSVDLTQVAERRYPVGALDSLAPNRGRAPGENRLEGFDDWQIRS
jgi:hypothetical protein